MNLISLAAAKMEKLARRGHQFSRAPKWRHSWRTCCCRRGGAAIKQRHLASLVIETRSLRVGQNLALGRNGAAEIMICGQVPTWIAAQSGNGRTACVVSALFALDSMLRANAIAPSSSLFKSMARDADPAIAHASVRRLRHGAAAAIWRPMHFVAHRKCIIRLRTTLSGQWAAGSCHSLARWSSSSNFQFL